MVLNMPRSAVKVNPMASIDFIFTIVRSRLLLFNCSSCFSVCVCKKTSNAMHSIMRMDGWWIGD